MKTYYRVVLKTCPALALLFSLTVAFTTIYIGDGISPVFAFLFVQVYLNWYCVYTISANAVTLVSTVKNASDFEDGTKIQYNYWYCEKCLSYTRRPAQHCSFCQKCFHHRDHHCFFIGGCVLRQNMGNFILICFYASLSCLYSLSVLGPYLYEHLDHFIKPTPNVFNIVANFSFPVAFARLLLTDEDTCIVLVTLFDALFSTFCISLVYGTWKLYVCLAGKQKYHPHTAKKQGLAEIFGSYGLANIIFPYNGLSGNRDVAEKYELKEV